MEVPYSDKVDGIAADPEPDWSFDALLLELNSLENKFKASSNIFSPMSKARYDFMFGVRTGCSLIYMSYESVI